MSSSDPTRVKSNYIPVYTTILRQIERCPGFCLERLGSCAFAVMLSIVEFFPNWLLAMFMLLPDVGWNRFIGFVAGGIFSGWYFTGCWYKYDGMYIVLHYRLWGGGRPGRPTKLCLVRCWVSFHYHLFLTR